MKSKFFFFFLSVWLFLVNHSPLRSQIDSGLVARYCFNGNLNNDAAGLPARAYGGGSFEDDRFGNSKYAYFLPGNFTDYINLGNSPAIKPRAATISLWVKIYQPLFSGYGADHNPIIYTRAHQGEDMNEAFFMGYHLTLRKINVATSMSEEKQVIGYQAGTAYLRQWYHLAITFDDNFLSFYIDGVLESKTPKNFISRYLENDSVIVGNRTSKRNNRYLQGCVDDIMIFNRVLSPSEIMQLYNAPNPNKVMVILKWIGIILTAILFLALILLLIRLRIKKVLNAEKEKNTLLNKWYEQENRVLSAQMDPHFIFNSLNTIQEFIITNENDKAQMYLSKFSRLMRKILESNTRENISLKEEVEIFEKYLEIESLRFNKVFTYTIVIDSSIDAAEVHIPHFLIQPLIENAIWHGLLPKEGDKKLFITFIKLGEKLLSCTVEDNGVGRKVRSETDQAMLEKKQSLAINFIEQRLSLLQKIRKVDCGIKIIDNVDENNNSTGTKVEIIIPILEPYVQSNNN